MYTAMCNIAGFLTDMLTTTFLNFIFYAIMLVIGLLPVVLFPTEIVSGIQLFWSYMNLFAMVIPVGAILTVLVLSFFYRNAHLVWKFGHWILRRLRH